MRGQKGWGRKEGSTVHNHSMHTLCVSTVMTTSVPGEDWQLGNDHVATDYWPWQQPLVWNNSQDRMERIRTGRRHSRRRWPVA